MKTKLKTLIALSLFILLMFSLSIVALAGTATNGNVNLHSNDEVGLAPDGIGLLATFGVVTTTDDVDTNPGDGVCDTAIGECTLRAAIEEANAVASHDTINVPAGTYLLTHANGDLDITSTLTIAGAGIGNTIIENAGGRAIDIDRTAAVTITGVTIRSSDDNSIQGGGGIRNEGTLLLTNSRISENTTNTNGGGIFNDGTGSRVGDLTIIDSIITSNSADEAGGGIFNKNGTVTISNSIVSLNGADADSSVGVGGGIANSAEDTDATLTVIQSQITTNTVEGVGGGGISNSADADQTATVILSKTLVSGNVATAITTVDSTMGFGGGIRNGFFSTGNNSSSAILTVNNSTISNNTAFNGGGIGSGTTIGGSPTLQVTVNNSAISGNTADGLNGNDVIGNGGGLINQNGTMNLVNSTVSGNTATGGVSNPLRGLGGGIANSGFTINTTVAFSNTTISGNTAAQGGNALANLHLGAATEAIFKNTIIAGNCTNPNLSGQGTLTSNGYNMDNGNTCNFTDSTDFTNTNPLLELLQNNGGDTETHALPDDSPAIDAGICVSGLTTDQRDEARPNAVSVFCDIGAYESSSLGTADLEITKVVTPTQADPGQAITYTVTFVNNGPGWAGDVVITDVVPQTVTGVAVTNSGATITATSGVTYSWTLGNLGRGGSGIITITGIISPSVLSGSSFINTALINNVNDNDTDSATVAIGESDTTIYMPLILKNS